MPLVLTRRTASPHTYRCAFLRGRVTELEARAAETVIALGETQASLKAAVSEAATASDRWQRSESEAEHYRSVASSLIERLHSLEMDGQRKSDELASLRAVSTRLTTDRLTQAADVRRLRESREVWERRAAELEEVCAERAAQLERATGEAEALSSRIRQLDLESAACRAELRAEREALRMLRAEHASLQSTEEERFRVLSAASRTREAIAAQLQREAAEVSSATARAAAAEAECLAEKRLRIEAEAKASLVSEQLRAYQERCTWLHLKLGEAQTAAQGAAARERLCEAESTNAALRMGLFQRIVTADAEYQQSLAEGARRDLPLRKASMREQSARRAAWNRLHEIGGA